MDFLTAMAAQWPSDGLLILLLGCNGDQQGDATIFGVTVKEEFNNSVIGWFLFVCNAILLFK